MNKAILMGRLVKDPEVRYSQSNEPVAVVRYTLAVNKRFKREGEPDADFIQCVAFGKTGEFAEKYFRKGQMVAVCGRISVRSWDDQTGQKRWSTEVVIDDQYFAESKASFEASQNQRGSAPAMNYPSTGQQAPDGFYAIDENLDDDDLPF